MTLQNKTLLLFLGLTATALVGCKKDPASQSDDADETDGIGGSTESTTGDPGQSGTATDATSNPSADGSTTDDSGPTDTGDEPEEPHALGVIELSEWHRSDGSQITPGASAVFVPDAAKQTQSCTEIVGGCTIAEVPQCDPQCAADEYCSFDDDCQSTCVPVCDAACASDEVCYFPVPGQAACRKIEQFDAGSLNFSGTSVQLTLLPPYAFQGDTTGSLFAAGAQLSVSASGAAQAGFQGFEESFTATQIVQTHLEQVSRAEAFGSGPLPVRWVAGQDEIDVIAVVVSPNGWQGSLQCDATDASGQFEIPRNAIRAAIDGADPSNMMLMVRRSRAEIKKGLATKGMLSSSVVQPTGWLELRTVSAEAHPFEGCGQYTACGDSCVDTSSDPQHCGGCGMACSGNEPCQNGTCGCSASQFTCGTGQCIPLNYLCDNDNDCGDGSDEADCGNCSADQFACSNGSCVAQSDVCDEQDDCGDGSDEAGCGAWNCAPEYFGTGDGCDCGCGVVDPDCASSSATSCQYCNNPGSCDPSEAGCPGAINPANNATCI